VVPTGRFFRIILIISLNVISATLHAQIRINKLVVAKGETYAIVGSDILVADTLVMQDSSRIVLNSLRTENFIRVTVALFGNNCVIDGNGVNGKAAPKGNPGQSPIGPCQNATAGRNGPRGLDGTSGINLFFYIDQLKSIGSLTIRLSGGNGGDGGDGGPGGGGSPGTTHCFGGNGGDGGNGGVGGNGGNGGVLTLGGKDKRNVRALLGDSFNVQTSGGTFGYGGIAGYAGPPGLGPGKKNGKPGVPGKEGQHGRPGNMGTIHFEDNN
jgi:hypothetical protein